MTILAIIAAALALAYAAVQNDRRRAAVDEADTLRAALAASDRRDAARNAAWIRAAEAWEEVAVQVRATRAVFTAARADDAGTTTRIADPRRERLAARAARLPGPEELACSSTVTAEHPPLATLTGRPTPPARRSVLQPA